MDISLKKTAKSFGFFIFWSYVIALLIFITNIIVSDNFNCGEWIALWISLIVIIALIIGLSDKELTK